MALTLAELIGVTYVPGQAERRLTVDTGTEQKLVFRPQLRSVGRSLLILWTLFFLGGTLLAGLAMLFSSP